MTDRLPLLISVPHGGLSVPEEVAGLCRLTLEEIVQDGDEGAAEIYDFPDEVRRHVTTDVARAIVDLNRAEDDFRKDGVIKTHTCFDVPVYHQPPSAEQVELLLRRHHRPYHAMLSSPHEGVVLGVDCHTMAAVGPPVGPDTGVVRPRACLGDGGGSLPAPWFDLLHECFVECFDAETTRNEPFGGGYITRTHRREMPWVQIELSRGPWIPNEEKRERVLASLRRFCARLPDRM